MEQECIGTQTAQLKFHKFDLVWAKILGWPWWPGRVIDIPSKNKGNYKVEFIADPSHAFLSEEKLLPYQEGRDRHSTPKSHHRNFCKALAQADRLAGHSSCTTDEARGDYSNRSSLLHQQIQIINQEQQAKCSSAASIPKKNIAIPRSITIKKKCKGGPSDERISRIKKTRKLIEKKQKIEERKVFVDQLLKKYRLFDIPKYQKGARLQNILKKGKKRSDEQEPMQQYEMIKYVSRVIERALRSKVFQNTKRFKIATSLGESVVKNRKKGTKGVHRAVFQWINNNEGETIEMSYLTWPIEEKTDHLTFTESL